MILICAWQMVLFPSAYLLLERSPERLSRRVFPSFHRRDLNTVAVSLRQELSKNEGGGGAGEEEEEEVKLTEEA